MEIGSGICFDIKGIFSIYLAFSPFFAEQTLCVVFLGQFQYVIQ